MFKIIFATIGLATLVSCGGQTKEDISIVCSGQDWAGIGYQAVKDGKPVRYFDKYKNSCGEKLDSNAMSLYQEGYVKAAIEFCTEQNGYEYGSNGRDAPDVCPFELKKKFATGYRLGDSDRRENIARLNRLKDRNEQEAYQESIAKPEGNPANLPH